MCWFSKNKLNYDLTHVAEKMSKTKKLKSLSEQLKDLSTPQPVSYHPDQEDQDDLTAAKVVDFSYEEEPWSLQKGTKVVEEFDDDPKYSGRAISRRDLQDSEGVLYVPLGVFARSTACFLIRINWCRPVIIPIINLDCDHNFLCLESNDEVDEQLSDDDQEQSEGVDSDEESDQSDAEEGDHMSDSDEPETPSQDQPQHSIATISLASLQEDIEKGKAAKHQLGKYC